MTDHERAWQLIQRYLDGLTTDAEARELEAAVQQDPEVANAFARAARTDAYLDEFFTDSRHDQRGAKLLRDLPGKPGRRQSLASPVRWAAAAVLLAAVGSSLYFLPPTAEAVPYQVVAGRVLVDGVESHRIREGARVEVVGDEAAVIRLAADGSQAELSPSSKGIIRGRMGKGNQVIELTQGSGDFHLENGEGAFRVETPVGEVCGSGAEFAVELRPPDQAAGKEVPRKMVPALVVAVMAGTVDVQYDNDRYTLALGDNRIYAAGKPAAERKPELTGQVIALAEDGKSFTLETPPAAKKEPSRKQTVHLTEQTKLSFVNVPLHTERPTVGYQARVWLAGGSAESAVAVTFSGQKRSAPKPDLAGLVTAISADGKALTLQLPSKKKGERGPTATVQLGDQTQLAYAFVPMDGEKPTVGYNVTVWLAAGSPDTASAVTFSGKKGQVPEPDWRGWVTAVSPDGKELTLQLAGKKKGENGPTAIVRISDQTKLVFAGIDKGQQKPTVGFEVVVWLDKGARDTAAGIRFSAPAGKKRDPTPMPK